MKYKTTYNDYIAFQIYKQLYIQEMHNEFIYYICD
jgi:hypothetical protein